MLCVVFAWQCDLVRARRVGVVTRACNPRERFSSWVCQGDEGSDNDYDDEGESSNNVCASFVTVCLCGVLCPLRFAVQDVERVSLCVWASGEAGDTNFGVDTLCVSWQCAV